jgi:DNA polymerase III epsilon subunit-like protein
MIAVDVETTNPRAATGSIISLGAVDTDEPTNQFYDECRIWDGAEVSEQALAINGFTHEELNDPSKKTEAELITAFIAWATDRPENTTLVAQNPSFDRDFIKNACYRAGIEFPFADRTIDIHSITWLHMTQRYEAGEGEVSTKPPTDNKHSVISLDKALNYCGIPFEPKPHNALTGALSHAEVFSRIAYTKSILPEFAEFPIPWQKH